MSYGVQIRTQNGLESIENLRSAQIVLEFTTTNQSGSASVPAGITSTNSFALAIALDNKVPAKTTISNGSVVWTALTGYTGANPSSNMQIYVMRAK